MSSWVRVSHQLACPVCGRPDWCQISEDGEVVMCMRVSSEKSGENARGETFYIHRQSDNPTPIPGELRRVDTGVDTRAAPEVRDVVYRALLDQLTLRSNHLMDLRGRGLSDTGIRVRGYKSWPLFDRRRDLCGRMPGIMEGRAQVVDLLTVPGFYCTENGHLALAGNSKSFAIPCRDPQGRILGMQLRHDDPGDGPKYIFLSSWKHGGPKSGYLTHVPLFEGASEEVRITEGFLKADVATTLGGGLCVGMSNCSAFRGAIPILRELGARRVVFALDADVRTNRLVALGLVNAALAMEVEGFEVAVEGWDPGLGKGIDDVLSSGKGRFIRRATGDRAWDALRKVCSLAQVVPPFGLANKIHSSPTVP